jgi:hypothetical protein
MEGWSVLRGGWMAAEIIEVTQEGWMEEQS